MSLCEARGPRERTGNLDDTRDADEEVGEEMSTCVTSRCRGAHAQRYRDLSRDLGAIQPVTVISLQ